MPQLINTGDELLRINKVSNTIEISRNGGRSWVTHCADSTSYGTFRDLFQYGGEILACTSRGLDVSTSGGRSFVIRCQNTSAYGEFQTLSTDPSGNLAAGNAHPMDLLETAAALVDDDHADGS